MADPLDIQGLWWLPDDRDHKVPGWFTWSPDCGGDLRLLGQFRPDTWEDNVLPDGTVQKVKRARARTRRDLTYALVHGQVGNKNYTLLDGISITRRGHLPSDMPTERVHIDRVLEATAWFTDINDLRFDRAHIDLRHLTAWVGHTGLTVEHPEPPGTDDAFAVITAKCLPRLETPHQDGTVSLSQSLLGTGDHLHTAAIEQRWRLRLAYSNGRSLDFFADVASDIQDLVSIAAGKTADFENVTLEHPDVPLLSLAGTQIGDARAKVTHYARWSNRSEPTDPVRRHELYFNFDDFDGVDGLQRWLEVAQTYHTELGRVMATRYSHSIYLEDRLMNVCAALESFDKVRRETGSADVYYVDRLKECIAYAGTPFANLIVTETDSWATKVKDLRHDLAHHRDRFRMNVSDAEHVLSEQLFWLFAICILRLAGAPDAVFESIARHSKTRWVSEQAEEAAEP